MKYIPTRRKKIYIQIISRNWIFLFWRYERECVRERKRGFSWIDLRGIEKERLESWPCDSRYKRGNDGMIKRRGRCRIKGEKLHCEFESLYSRDVEAKRKSFGSFSLLNFRNFVEYICTWMFSVWNMIFVPFFLSFERRSGNSIGCLRNFPQ